MVKEISIGILGIQGAISEHVMMMKKVVSYKNLPLKVLIIKEKSDLDAVQGLIIPGGESTTISRFLKAKNFNDIIKQRVHDQTLSVMGTCAGCVLIASKIEGKSRDINLLSLMDIQVKRNAFGRQRQSFEHQLKILEVGDNFPAVFIRAPIILKTWGNCKPLSIMKEGIVMARQKNILGLSFHPELTHDTRIHEYFFNMVNIYTNRI